MRIAISLGNKPADSISQSAQWWGPGPLKTSWNGSIGVHLVSQLINYQ
jgi:hypothetical protein